MVTEEKAIQVIRCTNFCGLCTTGNCKQCEKLMSKEMAINALEKQIPKTPIKEDSGVNDYDFDYKCPNCGAYIDKDEHHCECGQVIDWKSVKEGDGNE